LGFAQDGKNKPTFSVDLDPFLSGFNVQTGLSEPVVLFPRDIPQFFPEYR